VIFLTRGSRGEEGEAKLELEGSKGDITWGQCIQHGAAATLNPRVKKTGFKILSSGEKREVEESDPLIAKNTFITPKKRERAISRSGCEKKERTPLVI